MRRPLTLLAVVLGLAWAGAACGPAEPCPLCDAVEARDVARVRRVLQEGVTVDRVSWELAVTSLGNGDAEGAGLVALLARHGADPNHTISAMGEARRGAHSRSGSTAVAGIIAGNTDDVSILDALIANGLDVEGGPGAEALVSAAAAAHPGMVARLVAAGVPVNAVVDRQTALALAIQTRHLPTISVLEKAGGLEW
jgi:hypothetical protein